MSLTRAQEELPSRAGDGWQEYTCCSPAVFGKPVPLRTLRYVLAAGASGPDIDLIGEEAMLYVAAGSGELRIVEDTAHLEPESMAWLPPGGSLQLRAGDDGLDVLLALAPGTLN
jgi:quercetin dioxygenase-like cupin family protein